MALLCSSGVSRSRSRTSGAALVVLHRTCCDVVDGDAEERCGCAEGEADVEGDDAATADRTGLDVRDRLARVAAVVRAALERDMRRGKGAAQRQAALVKLLLSLSSSSSLRAAGRAVSVVDHCSQSATNRQPIKSFFWRWNCLAAGLLEKCFTVRSGLPNPSSVAPA